ncbi:MAG TPA: class I SAM-dependent methyltransferase [Spirochaetota bacterium]|nr:class I SAM-dependent methyltransferase [Spirochaetota bacterium]HPI88845.1 class I SAM-dependent methyltransferase [Spirochaetota bacterium]HPR47667.1 class I SAM-dependent methyltransferase [Spirochaetota bacterium]
MKLYSELAEYYFAIEKHHRNINDDIIFIKSLIGINNSDISILDIGCGTGEHLGILSKNGARCVGLDISPEMLAIAQNRFPENISFIQSDMRDFDYYEEFDLVLSLFGSMNYMIEDSDLEQVLWNIWRAMKPGGTGIIEIWHNLPVQKIKKKEPASVSQTKCNDLVIDRKRGFSLLPFQDRTVVEVNYTYDLAGGNVSKIIRDRHIMRSFSKTEITRFLNESGFSVKAIYANFRKELFDQNSARMIIVFTKD